MADVTHKDALLFYSIAYENRHHGTATLAGIFSATDAIYRIAPTFEELNKGLGIFLAAGLITEKDQGYLLTAKGRELYTQVNQSDRNVFENIEYLAKLLRKQLGELTVEDRAYLNRDHVRQAYRSYYGEE